MENPYLLAQRRDPQEYSEEMWRCTSLQDCLQSACRLTALKMSDQSEEEQDRRGYREKQATQTAGQPELMRKGGR